MSELKKLLEGVNVEWKVLGEVSDFLSGFAFKSNLFKSEGLPIVRITNITGEGIDLSNTKFFSIKDYNNGIPLKYSVEKGEFLIAMSGATTGKLGFYNYDEKAYINQRVGKFIPNKNIINNRFLFHILNSKTEELYQLAGGGAQPNLSSKIIKEKLQIPIPCPDNPEKSLQIQEEIVRILDRLSEETNQLNAALQKELVLHQKRYDFYREELFKFEGKEVEWKSLGEVSKVLRGRRLTKSQLTSEGYPVYHGGLEPLGFYHEFNRPSESVMIINVGASAGNVGYSSNDFWSSDGCYCLKQIENLNTKYLFYFLLSQEFYLKSKVRYAGIPTLDSAIIEKIKIPIPCPRDLQKSLEIQKEIVQLLDQFDEATITIAAQLKKEIALRNKQYQYYRDCLLSFPK